MKGTGVSFVEFGFTPAAHEEPMEDFEQGSELINFIPEIGTLDALLMIIACA